MRVNYVLIDATTLRQIDAYSATSPAGDPFALQDRVATWAAGVLALQLNGAERQTLLASGTRAPGALELFLQGRGYLLNYQTPGNIDAAIDLFNRAIALDSRYAPAYAASAARSGRSTRRRTDPARVQQARTACAQAVALDAELPASHVCLGTIALGTGAVEEAVQEFERAVDREPTSDEANLGLARAQARAARAAEAEATYQRAIALRPQYWATHIWLGTFYRERARYPEAVRDYELALALTPDNARVYYILCGMVRNRLDRAVRRGDRRVPEIGGDRPERRARIRTGAPCCRISGGSTRRSSSSRRRAASDLRTTSSTATWRARYFHAGRRAEAMTLYDRAIALVDQALTVDPRDVDARISAAAYHAKIGNRRAGRSST